MLENTVKISVAATGTRAGITREGILREGITEITTAIINILKKDIN